MLISNYELTERISEAPQTVVYRARDEVRDVSGRRLAAWLLLENARLTKLLKSAAK
jgi:hypothetical protein